MIILLWLTSVNFLAEVQTPSFLQQKSQSSSSAVQEHSSMPYSKHTDVEHCPA